MSRLRAQLAIPLCITLGLTLALVVALGLLKQETAARAAPLQPVAITAGPGSTTLISRGSGINGPLGNSNSTNPSLSFDGQLVAFDSNANTLVAGDGNGSFDIFIRNIKYNTTQLVSLSHTDVQGDGSSIQPSISANGTRVAFASNSSNLAATTNTPACVTPPCYNIFVRDRIQRTTLRVTNGIYDSVRPSLSANGRFVVFESEADNAALGDTNGVCDIYLYDLESGTTTLISAIVGGGGAGNGQSRLPVISGNGEWVVFYSRASDLVNGDTNTKWDVFVRHITSALTLRVSVSAAAVEGNDDSGGTPTSAPIGYAPSISFNGRLVSFHSNATNLVAGDGNAAPDVFVKEVTTDGRGAIQLISVSRTGGPGNGASTQSSLSGNGRWIAFSSEATDLVPNDTNALKDIFYRDLEAGVTFRASVGPGGAQTANSGSSYAPIISTNGRFVAFSSFDNGNLDPDDTNLVPDSFVHDFGTMITGRFRVPPGLALTRQEPTLGKVFAANANPLINEVFESTINADGSFSITLPSGQWYLKYALVDLDWYGPPLNDGNPIETAPEEVVPLPEIALRATGTETHARIELPDGQPLTEARLVVTSHISDSQPLIRDFSYNRDTQDWAFNVSCGLQVLSVQAPYTATVNLMVPKRFEFDPCVNPVTGPITLQYRPAPIVLSGTLFLNDGNSAPVPIREAYIWARNPHGGHFHIETDDNGTYQVRIAPGTWEFATRYDDSSGTRYGTTPQPIYLDPDDTQVTLDFTLTELSLPPLPEEYTASFPANEDYTFSLEDGTEIYVPANALGASGNVSITITPLDAHLPRTDAIIPAQYGYELTAYDDTGALIEGPFADEVRLTFPITSTDADTDTLRVFYLSHDENAYNEVEDYVIDESTGQIHAFVDHFSCWIHGRPTSLDEEITFVQAASSGDTTVAATVAFTATTTPSEDILLTWDFGDGEGDTGVFASHTYTEAGTYTVTLTAENGSSSVIAAPITVEVASTETTLWLPIMLR